MSRNVFEALGNLLPDRGNDSDPPDDSSGSDYVQSDSSSEILGDLNVFPVGHEINSETRGLWISTIGMQKANGDTVVFIDTEGTDRYKKPLTPALQNRSQSWPEECFTIPRLGYVINKSLCQSTPSDFSVPSHDRFRPDFLWLIRDKQMKPIVDGRSVTANTFFQEKILKCWGGKRTLSEVFQECNCREIPLPATDHCFLAEMVENPQRVSQVFWETLKGVVSDILCKIRAKRTCSTDEVISGPKLATYMETLLQSFKTEREQIIRFLVAAFEEWFNVLLSFHNEDRKEPPLEEEQNESLEERKISKVSLREIEVMAVKKVQEDCSAQWDCLSYKDAADDPPQEIWKRIEDVCMKHRKKNKSESEAYCTKLVKCLSGDIHRNLYKNVHYTKTDFRMDLQRLECRYFHGASGPFKQKVFEKEKNELEQNFSLLQKDRQMASSVIKKNAALSREISQQRGTQLELEKQMERNRGRFKEEIQSEQFYFQEKEKELYNNHRKHLEDTKRSFERHKADSEKRMKAYLEKMALN
ncbi:guanylate-binding protein 4-like [Lingula anatina]|uniref:Guanylate-binding protein 4-like n=1 Tax=Lingula anatina TaxID=7574 RepID=A0A1S3K4P5_LINAN|nr:guanylate-binding protein 4-like [Lingula anatina]|eukprot:XP_013417226.1 guanylate-binding protein 4-like [Lingula anatina]